MSTEREEELAPKRAEVFTNYIAEQSSSLDANTASRFTDYSDKTQKTGKESISGQVEEVDGCKEELFVAALSSNDRSTPFWIGRIMTSTVENVKATEMRGSLVRVRWYQASGSAKDPFDAAYTPAIRTFMMGGREGDCSFWESTIAHSEIIATFPNLTNEKRLGTDTVTKIKEKLYK